MKSISQSLSGIDSIVSSVRSRHSEEKQQRAAKAAKKFNYTSFCRLWTHLTETHHGQAADIPPVKEFRGFYACARNQGLLKDGDASLLVETLSWTIENWEQLHQYELSWYKDFTPEPSLRCLYPIMKMLVKVRVEMEQKQAAHTISLSTVAAPRRKRRQLSLDKATHSNPLYGLSKTRLYRFSRIVQCENCNKDYQVILDAARIRRRDELYLKEIARLSTLGVEFADPSLAAKAEELLSSTSPETSNNSDPSDLPVWV